MAGKPDNSREQNRIGKKQVLVSFRNGCGLLSAPVVRVDNTGINNDETQIATHPK
jgi:hypothetical protein